MIVRADELRKGDVVIARVPNKERGTVADVKIEDGRVFINYESGEGMTASVADQLLVRREE